MPKIRILLVEDFEPFRRFVRSTLAARPEYQVVGEVSDGLEAVQKAVELQPDLIVLDVGLPGQDGFKAARQIRRLCRRTKILFLSQESSPDAIAEAFRLGAHGYLVKTRAPSDLLTTVEEVCRDIQSATNVHQHVAQFLPDDETWVASFVDFIRHELSMGKAVIVLATESHRQSLVRALQEHGVDIGTATKQGRYIPLDADETLASFMDGDLVVEARFRKAADKLIASAAGAVGGDPSRVAACGEGTPRLWMGGKVDAAVQLEHLWDEIARANGIHVLCGFVLEDAQRRQEDVYKKICAEHSANY